MTGLTDNLYHYLAKVTRWVDGDTVYLDVDMGFRIHFAGDFRLAKIDTPERGQVNWAEATAKSNELGPIGSTVLIKSYKAPDKYGRWLVEIWDLNGTTKINDALVEAGLAKVYVK